MSEFDTLIDGYVKKFRELERLSRKFNKEFRADMETVREKVPNFSKVCGVDINNISNHLDRVAFELASFSDNLGVVKTRLALADRLDLPTSLSVLASVNEIKTALELFRRDLLAADISEELYSVLMSGRDDVYDRVTMLGDSITNIVRLNGHTDTVHIKRS